MRLVEFVVGGGVLMEGRRLSILRSTYLVLGARVFRRRLSVVARNAGKRKSKDKDKSKKRKKEKKGKDKVG